MSTRRLPPIAIVSVIALITPSLLLRLLAASPPRADWLTAPSPGARSATASGTSLHPVLSADGSTAVFVSDAPNLVHADSQARRLQVYARPVTGGALEGLSVTPIGTPGNARSHSPTVSADGRFVAFVSDASDLVPNDTNGLPDVFVRDRTSRTTRLVSIGLSGQVPADGPSHSPHVTPDGRFVLFESSARNLVLVPGPGPASVVPGVFLHDLQSSVTHWINAPSDDPAIATNTASAAFSPVASADGTKVAFRSAARNLAASSRGNHSGLFVREVPEGRTRMLDVLPGEISGRTTSVTGQLALQPAGRWLLAALNGPPDLPPLGLHWIDLETGALLRAAPTNLPSVNSSTEGPFLSRDGRTAVFEIRRTPLTSSGFPQVYATTQGEVPILIATNLVALDRGFTRREPVADLLATDADADRVAYLAPSPDAIGADRSSPRQLWITRRSTAEARRIGRRDWHVNAPSPSFSADGRLLLFASNDPELVSEDGNGTYDVFLYDWESQSISLVSAALDPAARQPAPGGRIQGPPVVSRDGRILAFVEPVHPPGILLLDRSTGHESRLGSVQSNEFHAEHPTFAPSLSADGRVIAFLGTAQGTISADGAPGPVQAYLRPRSDAAPILASRMASGAPSNQSVTDLDLSPDGDLLAFVTTATLSSDDANSLPDVYLFHAEDQTVRLATPLSISATANARIAGLTWSPNGRTLLMVSESLLSGALPSTVNPRNPRWYALDRETGKIALLHALPTGFGTGNTPDVALPVGTERPRFNRDGTLAALTLFRQSQYTNVILQSLSNPEVSVRITHAERPALDDSGARAVVRRTAPTSELGRLQFVDTLGAESQWIDAASTGNRASAPARWWSLRGDASAAFFTSPATNLHPLATQGFTQLYLRDLHFGSTLLLSVSAEGHATRGPVSNPVHHLPSDTVYFTTSASNLDPADSNEVPDLYSVTLGESPVGLFATLTRLASGAVTLVAPALPGKRYRADWTERIESQSWVPIGTSQVAEGTQIQFRNLPTNASEHRFYRIVRED